MTWQTFIYIKIPISLYRFLVPITFDIFLCVLSKLLMFIFRYYFNSTQAFLSIIIFPFTQVFFITGLVYQERGDDDDDDDDDDDNGNKRPARPAVIRMPSKQPISKAKRDCPICGNAFPAAVIAVSFCTFLSLALNARVATFLDTSY